MNAGVPATPAAEPVVITIGNPNTGKSTLFNHLTGLRQKVSNYAGVTVERVSGHMSVDGVDIHLVDVPGTYSLAAHSPDEMIAVDVLHGASVDLVRPACALVVVDATNLRRNLFLVTQVLEAEIPVVVALNMIDLLETAGVELDCAKLQDQLGVPVVPIAAAEGRGIEALKQTLADMIKSPSVPSLRLMPEIDAAVEQLGQDLQQRGITVHHIELRRALIDASGYAEQRLVERHGEFVLDRIHELRKAAGGGRSLSTLEARDRYSWIQTALKETEQRTEPPAQRIRDSIDAVVNHPVIGTALFALVMATVFQAVFAWAGPLVDGIDYLTGSFGSQVSAWLGDGLFASFLSDGVIAGVGSVVVFLPQIIILFAFIIILEDSGYMSRAAFLMDRVMRGMGLSGQSFIPMLSSFACAVPGIMGTRTIANQYDRLATIMAAPFMTCSARLPIYSLLIAAFVPDTRYASGLINLQGLVLFGLYVLGILGGAATAWMISRLYWARTKSRFLLEMPPYRMPNARALLSKLLTRALVFLRRAGTIIFLVAIAVWALASFPRPSAHAGSEQAPTTIADSYLGRMSIAVAPVFAPLGWDWKITAAVLASFPAREVVIAALATIYAVDTTGTDDAAGSTLTRRIQNARHVDGTPVYTLPMVIGLLIFYAFCLQCAATIAVMRRETGSWRWPLIAWTYMTGLGYAGAFAAFQIGTWLQVG
jgi:ferrous iron transport protein B